MSSERLRYIRPSWIAFGWFIAASVSALLLLALVAVGILGPDSHAGEASWVAATFVAGFLVGGFFAGVRADAAPILHGLGIGLFSLVVWFLANLIPGEATGWTAWRALPAGQVVGLLLMQTVAAIVGARMGVRWTRRTIAA